MGTAPPPRRREIDVRGRRDRTIPTWRQAVGTAVLAAIVVGFLHGGAREAHAFFWIWPLGIGVTWLVLFAARAWVAVESAWEEVGFRPTGPGLAAAVGAGLLLTGAIVLGGRRFGHDLDPWSVLAFLAATALVFPLRPWQDGTIRWRPGDAATDRSSRACARRS